MTDKEFLYSMYDADLVDRAFVATADFFQKSAFEADMKLAKIAEKYNVDGEAAENRMYNHLFNNMVFSYLHGANYAVAAELSTTSPSENTFSEFHKNVDFAVLFDFSDNDFGLAMEAAAKTYCNEFNNILRQIDMYDDHEYMKSSYIKEFNEIIKIENIKNIMKCGFASRQLSHSAEVICGRMPVIEQAMQKVRSDLEYIPWDGIHKIWEKSMDDYFVKEEVDRFITGTNAEIVETLKKHGDPFEDQTKPFPVWCNGEVVILYMKNGYLTYLIR